MTLNTENLQRKMQEKKVSQGELGRIIGVSQQTIFKWLHGTDPSLERFCQICEVLDVEPNFLLTREGELGR